MKNNDNLYVSKQKEGLAAPIHPLLEKRWSPRIFSTEALSEEKIAMLFEAARWAPSSFNEQPWLDGVDEERAGREMAPQKRRPVSEWLFDNEWEER